MQPRLRRTHRAHLISAMPPALLVACLVLSGVASAQAASGAPPDWSAVDQALGRKGTAQAGDVMKYSFPRSDMQVTVAGVQLRPALALGSWVAFKEIGVGRAMAMGDLVLREDEVGPVVQALQQGGVEQTAVHNHLLHESPGRVVYVHIAAHGDPAQIARTVRSALERSGTPLAAPVPAASAPGFELDTGAVARVLGVGGKVNGGVYQVSVPRREVIHESGHVIPPSMGVATAINFQPTEAGKAAITGDFVMRASEVNAVMRSLQEAGIEVTALHSHMLDEEPRLFFMHFWANDNAVKLAHGLRNALDKMAVKLGNM